MKIRDYLLKISARRSIIYLVSAIIISIVCFVCMISWVSSPPTPSFPEKGKKALRLFTLLSNIYAAAGAILLIPYAVDGVRNKRYTPAPWAVMAQYSGVLCTTITMTTALFLLWPINGADAVTGINFLLHVLCPGLHLLLFFLGENKVLIRPKQFLLCQIPFFIYFLLYFVMVFLIGEENGGWRDTYLIGEYVSIPFAVFGFTAISMLVSFLLMFFHNRLILRQEKKTVRAIRETFENSRPLLLTEAYGLGTEMSGALKKGNVSVPLDLFTLMADSSDEVTVEDLSKAFLKGLLS